MGRPTDYSPELADAICERIADGESLRSICSDDEMPNKATVFRWLAKDEAFRDQYARAREAQADALFDDVLDIADGRAAIRAGNDPDVQRDRLAVDARKWMAGKLRPKVYGEKQTHEHSGPDGSEIATVTRIELVAVEPRRDDDSSA